MDTRDMAVNLPQPTLDAGSFVLRPFAVDDLDLVRAAGTDPYIPLITTVPAVFTEAEGMRFIERQWERERQGAGYSFVIADARTGEGVGQIGLWLADASYGRAQVGYWVAPRRRGNGAAGHGLRAISVGRYTAPGRTAWNCIAWNCTWSRGTPPPGVPRNAWATSGRAYCAGGSGSVPSDAT